MNLTSSNKTSARESTSSIDPPVSVLIVDRDPSILKMLSAGLAEPELAIFTATSPEEGRDLASWIDPSILLIDWETQDACVPVIARPTGLVRQEREFDLVILSRLDTAEVTVSAIRSGAAELLVKPLSLPRVRACIRRLAAGARTRKRARTLEAELKSSSNLNVIIGQSQRMWDLFHRVRQVAPHYRTMLITGETGTGKELVARSVHEFSPVRRGPYVVVNCSAIVETLFESEMFGHAKGAFTGASHIKPGLFEAADGGSIFLDEIGDMPLAAQAKLLRVLQNGEVQRVGELSTRTVDVRVLAATNRDLRAAVAARYFREDLFYRLSMVEVETPSLVERIEDLPILVNHFISRFAVQFRKTIYGIAQRAQLLLERHCWPGNIRELENVIGRAVMMAASEIIEVEDLPPYLHRVAGPAQHRAGHVLEMPARAVQEDPLNPRNRLEEEEYKLLKRALEKTAGNQCRAARMLHIGRDALRYRMKKNNLTYSYVPRIDGVPSTNNPPAGGAMAFS